jgi:hypothetical protein
MAANLLSALPFSCVPSIALGVSTAHPDISSVTDGVSVQLVPTFAQNLMPIRCRVHREIASDKIQEAKTAEKIGPSAKRCDSNHKLVLPSTDASRCYNGCKEVTETMDIDSTSVFSSRKARQSIRGNVIHVLK